MYIYLFYLLYISLNIEKCTFLYQGFISRNLSMLYKSRKHVEIQLYKLFSFNDIFKTSNNILELRILFFVRILAM